jgi:lipopolysaccharide export system ATP-binding protein
MTNQAMQNNNVNTQDTIEAVNIEKFFGTRKVLNSPSIKIQRGESVGLLGPNGSGKTTLFYTIAGLLYPDGGQILFNGEDITAIPMYIRARKGLGYLPQDISIFRTMNVEQNIECILELYYKNKGERKDRLDEIIKDFAIGHIRKSPAMALSGGERRRVEIARTIASNPKFILLDEPFAGVDPIAVGDLRNLIISLKEKNIGILITDHNAKETLNIVDKAYILYNGTMIFSGSEEEIINNPQVQKVYLGDTFVD